MKEAIARENWVEDTQKVFSNFIWVLYKKVLKTNQTKQEGLSAYKLVSICPQWPISQKKIIYIINRGSDSLSVLLLGDFHLIHFLKMT